MLVFATFFIFDVEYCEERLKVGFVSYRRRHGEVHLDLGFDSFTLVGEPIGKGFLSL